MTITNIPKISTATDTFGVWVDRTNDIIESLEDVVTLGPGQNNDNDLTIQGQIETSQYLITDRIEPYNDVENVVHVTGQGRVEQNLLINNGGSGSSKLVFEDDGVDTWSISTSSDHTHVEISKGSKYLRIDEADSEITASGLTIDNDILPSPITKNLTGDVTGNLDGNVTGNLTGDVVGNVTIQNGGSLDASEASDVSLPEGFGFVPAGGIIMWSGSITSIPVGWALCDGSDGTPDLTDRFVVGAGSSYNVNDTGGSDSVELERSNLPSHSHDAGSLSTTTDGIHSHKNGLPEVSGATFYGSVESGETSGIDPVQNRDSGGTTTLTPETDRQGNHSHDVVGTTDSVGDGVPHENRPPYYALAYIMKL